MLEKVTKYMARNIPLPPGCRLVVGLSGGADSVALLDLLVRSGYDCTAAHCHFGLRGDEADRDLRFSRDTAERMAVPFENVAFDTHAYARTHRCSVEVACRELRYTWFERLRTERNAEAIAVAHHEDDAVETLFLNLLRGTGLAGVTGIRPVQGRVVRPLLGCTRAEIERYLTERQLPYVIDSTNREACYTRNRIRLQLLPMLEAIRPGGVRNVARSMHRLEEADRIYRSAIEEALPLVIATVGNTLRIDTEKVLRFPSPSSLLYEILKPYGFTPARCDEITENLSGEPGKRFYSATHRLVRDRKSLFLQPLSSLPDREPIPIPAGTRRIEYPVKLTLEEIPADTARPLLKTPGEAFFDRERLTFPLTLRRWSRGDRFTPFGMRGSQKISDYFSNRKYSLPEKENAWLLCSGDTVLWIVGERTASHAPVTEKTRTVLRLKCEI